MIHENFVKEFEFLCAELNYLKSLLEVPRLCLTKFFDDIKSEVDVAYSAKEINETDDEIRTVLRNYWTQTIDKITQYENECFKKKTVFPQEITHQTEEDIKRITEDLTDLKELDTKLDEFKIEDTDTLRNDLDESIRRIKELLCPAINRLEKILFQNKTITFFAANKATKHLQYKLFDQMNSQTTAGKLLYIKDTYLSKDIIEAYTKNSMSHLKLNYVLTNDLLKFGQLKAFDLSIEPIDEINMYLNGLEDLKLTYMSQETIDANVFNGFTSLKRIYFSNNKFVQITDQIFNELLCLEEVTIENNFISKIDKKLFNNLPSLTLIRLTRNRLIDIDKNAFNNLTNLKILDLSGNQLKKLDSNIFSSLLNLEWISLSFNQFESIDADLFKGLYCLTTLQLNSNKLKFISENQFKNLTKLARVNLANNMLGRLDSNVFNNLVNLKSICLSSNRLQQLDKNLFKGLNSLNHIELHNNQFKCHKLRLNLESSVKFVSFRRYNGCIINDLSSIIKNDNVEGKFFYLSYLQWSYLFKFSAILILPIIYKLYIK